MSTEIIYVRVKKASGSTYVRKFKYYYDEDINGWLDIFPTVTINGNIVYDLAAFGDQHGFDFKSTRVLRELKNALMFGNDSTQYGNISALCSRLIYDVRRMTDISEYEELKKIIYTLVGPNFNKLNVFLSFLHRGIKPITLNADTAFEEFGSQLKELIEITPNGSNFSFGQKKWHGVLKRFYNHRDYRGPIVLTGDMKKRAVLHHLFPSLFAALVDPWEAMPNGVYGGDAALEQMIGLKPEMYQDHPLVYSGPIINEAHRRRSAVGTPFLRDRDQAEAILNTVISEVIDNTFNWSDIVIAGGLVAKALDFCGEISDSTDIDMWTHSTVAFKRTLKYFQERGAVAFVRYPTLVTVVFRNTKRTVQVIRISDSIETTQDALRFALTHFDYSYVSAGIVGGRIFVHPRYFFSAMTGYELFNFDKRSRPHRIVKAAKAGHSVYNIGKNLSRAMAIREVEPLSKFYKRFMSQFEEKNPEPPVITSFDSTDPFVLAKQIKSYHPDASTVFFDYNEIDYIDSLTSIMSDGYDSHRNRDLISLEKPKDHEQKPGNWKISAYKKENLNTLLYGIVVASGKSGTIFAFSEKLNLSFITFMRGFRFRCFELSVYKPVAVNFNFVGDKMFYVTSEFKNVDVGSVFSMYPCPKLAGAGPGYFSNEKISLIHKGFSPIEGYIPEVYSTLSACLEEVHTSDMLNKLGFGTGYANTKSRKRLISMSSILLQDTAVNNKLDLELFHNPPEDPEERMPLYDSYAEVGYNSLTYMPLETSEDRDPYDASTIYTIENAGFVPPPPNNPPGNGGNGGGSPGSDSGNGGNGGDGSPGDGDNDGGSPGNGGSDGGDGDNEEDGYNSESSSEEDGSGSPHFSIEGVLAIKNYFLLSAQNLETAFNDVLQVNTATLLKTAKVNSALIQIKHAEIEGIVHPIISRELWDENVYPYLQIPDSLIQVSRNFAQSQQEVFSSTTLVNSANITEYYTSYLDTFTTILNNLYPQTVAVLGPVPSTNGSTMIPLVNALKDATSKLKNLFDSAPSSSPNTFVNIAEMNNILLLFKNTNIYGFSHPIQDRPYWNVQYPILSIDSVQLIALRSVVNALHAYLSNVSSSDTTAYLNGIKDRLTGIHTRLDSFIPTSTFPAGIPSSSLLENIDEDSSDNEGSFEGSEAGDFNPNSANPELLSGTVRAAAIIFKGAVTLGIKVGNNLWMPTKTINDGMIELAKTGEHGLPYQGFINLELFNAETVLYLSLPQASAEELKNKSNEIGQKLESFNSAQVQEAREAIVEYMQAMNTIFMSFGRIGKEDVAKFEGRNMSSMLALMIADGQTTNNRFTFNMTSLDKALKHARKIAELGIPHPVQNELPWPSNAKLQVAKTQKDVLFQTLSSFNMSIDHQTTFDGVKAVIVALFNAVQKFISYVDPVQQQQGISISQVASSSQWNMPNN